MRSKDTGRLLLSLFHALKAFRLSTCCSSCCSCCCCCYFYWFLRSGKSFAAFIDFCYSYCQRRPRMRFLCLLHLLSAGKNRLTLFKFLLAVVVVVLVVAIVLAIVRKMRCLVEIVSNSANLSAVLTLSFATASFA